MSNGWDAKMWSSPQKEGLLRKKGHVVRNWKVRVRRFFQQKTILTGAFFPRRSVSASPTVALRGCSPSLCFFFLSSPL